MSPSDLQNEIMKRIRKTLKNFPLDTEGAIPLSDNDTTPFKVFRQFLPEKNYNINEYDYEDDDDSDIYPFVTVNLPGGQQEGSATPQIEPVHLLVGVKNHDIDNRGFSDLTEAVQVIMDDLNEHPIIADMYVMQYPLRWIAYQEENTFPYFFAQIEAVFEIETTTYRGGLDDV